MNTADCQRMEAFVRRGVRGVVFTALLTAPQWLSSSVTVITICSKKFSIIRIMFYISYFQYNQLMTITSHLDLMTAHCVSKVVITF